MVESVQVKEWQQQAEARGRVKARIEAVVKVLYARLGTVPEDLAEKINDITDLDTLDAWLIQAVQADSLDAFRQATGL